MIHRQYDAASRTLVMTLPTGRTLRFTNVGHREVDRLMKKWEEKFGARSLDVRDPLNEVNTFYR